MATRRDASTFHITIFDAANDLADLDDAFDPPRFTSERIAAKMTRAQLQGQ